MENLLIQDQDGRLDDAEADWGEDVDCKFCLNEYKYGLELDAGDSVLRVCARICTYSSIHKELRIIQDRGAIWVHFLMLAEEPVFGRCGGRGLEIQAFTRPGGRWLQNKGRLQWLRGYVESLTIELQ